MRAVLIACCAALAASGEDAATAPDIVVVLERITEPNFSDPRRLCVLIRAANVGAPLPDGRMLVCENLHYAWSNASGVVLEDDVREPFGSLSIRGPLNDYVTQGVYVRLPEADGEYTLRMTLNGTHEAADSRRKDPPYVCPDPELKAVINASLIRIKQAVRGTDKDGLIILDGSQSEPKKSPDNTVYYDWEQISGPYRGQNSSERDFTQKRKWLQFFKPGLYVYELAVSRAGVKSVPAHTVIVAGDPSAVLVDVQHNRHALLYLSALLVLLGGALLIGLHRYYSVHLSTCLVVMLATGVLFFWNSVGFGRFTPRTPSEGANLYQLRISPGWPSPLMKGPDYEDLNSEALVQNAIVALALLTVLAVCFEHAVHRRRALKKDAP